MRNEVVKAPPLVNPFGGGHRSALIDPGDVVDFVTHERQVVDDPVRSHTVLGLDALSVQNLARHGVHKPDTSVHKLREILVAGRNKHVPAESVRAFGVSCEHIVGFNACDLNQGPAGQPDHFHDGLNLHPQVIGHRRAVGFVIGKNRVPEVFPGRVKNAGFVVRLNKRSHILEHPVKALDGARGLPVTRHQRGQRMVGAEQIVGSVDKQKSGHGSLEK